MTQPEIEPWSPEPLANTLIIMPTGQYIILILINIKTTKIWRCPRGVMVIAMDCGIVVSEFVLQSRYYVHIRANTLGKGMNPLILPAMG